jgi:oligoribonuclease NrnB/cAMP/cGMP phosphodiesterase (DHH superfamily)
MVHNVNNMNSVDYCGPTGFISNLSPLVKKIILLDHHKTAIELIDDMKAKSTIPGNFECVLELKQSGATISWDYFNAQKSLAHGFTADRAAAHRRMYSLVEDNDLWRHAIPESKDWTTGLANLQLEFDYGKNVELFNKLIAIGIYSCISSYQRKY